MLQSIVPPGYNPNEFPPALDGSQLAVREATATLAESHATVEATKALINAQINKYSKFFVAHFGLDSLNTIKKQYFPAGHTVKQGGGTGNTLSIAQELMAFKDPAPTDNYTDLNIAVMVGILNGILRIPNQQSKDAELKTTRLAFVEEAIFTLDHRPTRDSIIAGKGLPKYDLPAGKPSYGLGKRLANRAHQGWFQAFATKVGYKHGLTKNSNGVDVAPGIWMLRPHKDGFNVYVKPNIYNSKCRGGPIDYYQDAYTGTPKQYWEINSRHRLGVEMDPKYGTHNYTVKVYRVDPVTGAPTGQYYVVAGAPISQYQGNPGFLLAKVKKVLFPEMYLLSAGVSLSTSAREEFYKEQLENAKNMWAGIPDKVRTPISCVLEQSYRYQYIKDMQDPNAEWPTGTEPKQPGQNTTQPINGFRIFLQPTGIEEAMRRILDVSHPKGNAIEKWFVNDLTGAATQAQAGTNYKYTVSKTSIEFEDYPRSEGLSIKKRYHNTVKVVYALLDNPHIHAEGINARALMENLSNPGRLGKIKLWGRPAGAGKKERLSDFLLGQIPTTQYKQYIEDALKIFRYAGWPEGKPQPIFSAPVDDGNDLNIVMNMFVNYMKENTVNAPGQMYSPETFNGMLSYKIYTAPAGMQSTGQGGIPQYMFYFDKRIDPAIFYQKDGEQQWTANAPTPGVSQVIKKQRYHKGTKTAVSRRTVTGTKAITMPKPIAPQNEQGVFGSAQMSDIQTATGIGIAAGLGAVALVGYQLMKRRG
jgi:hypothetical protein